MCRVFHCHSMERRDTKRFFKIIFKYSKILRDTAAPLAIIIIGQISRRLVVNGFRNYTKF